MLISLGRRVQDPILTGPHWDTFVRARAQPDIYLPLRQLIVQQVDSSLAADPHTRFQSNHVGATALQGIGPWWHGEFSRKFPGFNSGGLTGMILWNYLVERNDQWAFSELEDAHGHGQDPKLYWRLLCGDPLFQAGDM